ncbi:2-oxoglutarate dehydrogenase E1 component [Pseudobacteriovorax antillogorgiicola]|uniref:oxoglutarate dehydrogenase (succinyl-transferring) n=1 Tax=Pseudobacteriovorax antillogorgiicola TaxID=1513793 RepID=A0A1Y6B6Q8_9BACT|nr:2-oxoglutarate dehydrogenase E1 component [Pseudobacteriovorax antillogorgiicola]TCS59461.1 2-oxoglutarate dehydrogenase E1 component [Pseudobacteriovorax antillogorgiicola]SME88154.1 2-oxoglutarate dehydrogenase E1 component [Pseudobacteriovorax antillogorgiicola]
MKGVIDEGKFTFANGTNAAFVDGLYKDYRNDPNSVDETWRKFFEGYEFALSGKPQDGGGNGDDAEANVESYINLYRRLGHLNAHLNPLDDSPTVRESFAPEDHGLGDVDMKRLFHPSNLPVKAVTFGEVQSLLQETYCGNIGADFRDINEIESVRWFQDKMERCRNKPEVDTSTKKRVFEKLIHAEGFEKFLQDRYLGQKRFSVEGLEALIPLLDMIATEAKAANVDEVCMGMAHRGRLNVLANFMGKPYELMLKEFEGSEIDSYGIDGDVKYHMGFANNIKTMTGASLRVYLSPNPSHLEAVNPVVEGFAKARQVMLGDEQQKGVMPILIHGDASFIGQGLVAETLNLSELESYKTGGTIHVITNNQVGFTTNPDEGRSCHYSSDIAKIVRAPVLHVNADDPEAVIWTAQMAVAYRQKFQRDVVIDLIGYRRHGHNETDEPGFTQPQMYKKIKKHPTVLKIYGDKLVKEGVLTEDQVSSSMKEFRAKLQDCLNRVRGEKVEVLTTTPKELESSTKLVKAELSETFNQIDTAIKPDVIKTIVEKVTSFPDSFKPHPKVAKLFKNRKAMIDGDGKIDWGLAEVLAFGSLALEGKHVRLSGQDCRRGTFSHRHAVIRDYETGAELHTLNQLSDKQEFVEVINSPLSEQGVLGFEFGYSVANREALVMWEAQFGDFSNGGQIIIDQFLAASEAKWKQASGLVLLLPHGYEGMGPEHSSARPERFLQLCGDNNMQVANLTTPAQLFHILRRQLHRPYRKPLVIMTPKSLLRHPECVSAVKDFTEGYFTEVIDDQFIQDKGSVERVVFCTGKIFYELDKARRDDDNQKVAIVRVEQLYPFPEEQVDKILKEYSKAKEVLWTQEEPSNMGAWTAIRHKIKQLSTRERSFRYSGRTSAGTTAEGSSKSHNIEQQRIIEDALTVGSKPGKKRASSK